MEKYEAANSAHPEAMPVLKVVEPLMLPCSSCARRPLSPGLLAPIAEPCSKHMHLHVRPED